MLSAAFLLFQHWDLYYTSPHGVMLLEAISNGRFNGFYGYVAESYGGAAYNILVYAVFALWNSPIFLLNSLGAAVPQIVIVLWGKLLLAGLLTASALEVENILTQLGADVRTSCFGRFLFLTSPLAFFAVAMFGQYDIFSVYLTLIALRFYLARKLWRFTLVITLAVCFKYFAFIAFVPLLLFAEKRIWRIALHLVTAFALSQLVMLPFSGDPALAGVGSFNGDILARFFENRIQLAIFPAALFGIIYTFLCLAAYAHDPDKEDFASFALYLPLATWSAFFLLVKWHPQWLIVLAPYLVLNLLANGRGDRRVLLYAEAALFCAFTGIIVIFWPGNVDNFLAQNGILSLFLATKFPAQALEMRDFFGVGAPLSYGYMAAFAGCLLFFCWHCRPGKTPFVEPLLGVTRPSVYLRFASLLIFALPALFCFGYSLHREKQILAKFDIADGYLAYSLADEDKDGMRPATFACFSHAQSPVLYPAGEKIGDRHDAGELAEGRTVLIPLGRRIKPRPAGLAILFAVRAPRLEGMTQIEFLDEKGARLWRHTFANASLKQIGYRNILFPPEMPTPSFLRLSSDAPAGRAATLLTFGARGKDVPKRADEAWLLDFRWLLEVPSAGKER